MIFGKLYNSQIEICKDTLKIIAGKESMITRRIFFPPKNVFCLQRVTNFRKARINSREEYT